MDKNSRKMTGMKKKGPWMPEEDKMLSSYIRKEGEGRWCTLPNKAGLLRCGKSCRLRWMNYLRPSLKRGHISPDEEDLILRLLGNRWSLIAGRIPGRTDNEIKNYWNTRLSKKLISRGIDPRTHKPLSSPSSSSPGDQPEPVSPNPHENIFNNSNDQMKQLSGNEEDNIVSYYPDDAFSLFLDSLINEEMCQDDDHHVVKNFNKN